MSTEEQEVEKHAREPHYRIDNPWKDGEWRTVNEWGEEHGKCVHGVELADECKDC